MQIKINGKQQDIKSEDALSLADLLKDKGLNFKNIVVECNREIITQDKWEQVVLKQDDVIEIVSFVGGG